MSREEIKTHMAYFVLGTIAGAAAGVLFAPKAGKETRQELGEWIKNKREKSSEFMSKLKEELPTKRDQVAAALRAGKKAYYEASGDRRQPENESLTA
ncbi:MAG: YtxH domain-containing protein [Elusimicrobia bacterium]|nr:YtxH domain-containing protein [Elusimicrobiota bacterium]